MIMCDSGDLDEVSSACPIEDIRHIQFSLLLFFFCSRTEIESGHTLMFTTPGILPTIVFAHNLTQKQACSVDVESENLTNAKHIIHFML